MTRYVALYCRISIDRQGRKEGVKAQERWGRDYVASAWPGLAVRVFADNDLSAAGDDVERPQYEALRAAVRSGEVAHVWAVEQSRLERREVQWFELAAELDAAGLTELHTNRDGIVRVRDEVAGIKAVLNAGEVRKLKKRVNDRLAENAANGCPPGAHTFGYAHGQDADGNKTYLVVPDQAEIVRQVADLVLSGWALTNVAAELRSRGLRGAKGGVFHANTVRKMVTNPTVAGYRVHQGRVVGRGAWEPILSEETWQACRLRLSQSRRVRRKDGGEYAVGAAHIGHAAGRRYLLTGGLAVCGVCSTPLVGAMRHRGKRANGERVPPVPYLTCHPNRGGRSCVGIMLERTEDLVVERLFEELDKPEFLEALGADEHGQRRDEITTALQAVERQRDELAALWATPGELTTSEWQAARRGLAEQEQSLRSELAAVPPPVVNVNIAGAREAWPEMTLDERREFVRLFIERVTVHPAAVRGSKKFDESRVRVEWRRA